ncbi:alpha/beta hydrolase [Kitasatospora sp. NBC_00240]|uniref:alpha/beta fold hydrolase n=1 Tax=Kitasatospora sp. NBC_00240 TaxID=2903567 RepID=UPI00224F9898|nr:alpha/beta hydrolase [Kitasatospora sp. NBC_00240]MCX5214999.1 alpha/beta hydrolase [Kitasatospora sp. NBC_00240]
MTDDCEILLGGIRLAHRVSGDPGSRPLVLLHALGEGAADWDGVRDTFARHRRVYAPDLRGHGRSDRPGTYSFELMRDDVLALLATLGPEPVDLVGHSMGAVVAYLVAAAAPERVRRLVLEDVPAPFPRKPSELTRPDGPLPYDWAVVPAIKGQLDEPDPAWLAALGLITAPTLVVAGGSRSHVPQDGIAELARLVPDCRIVTIPVGHLVHAARPEEFAVVVTDFLTAPDRPAGRTTGPRPTAARGG